MPLRLRVIPTARAKAGEEGGPTTERIVEFPDEAEEIKIGRRADLDLSLPFKALSSLHARLLRKRAPSGGRDTWVLEDLDSKNGTYVGNSRLKPKEQRLMMAGTEIDLAQVRVVFDGPSRAISGAEGTATIARRLVSDLLSGAPDATAPTLTLIDEADNATSLKLTERDRPYIVGRSKSCDFRINSDELSRQHASFTRGSFGIIVRDLGSKNGIKINGVQASKQRVRDGDIVSMGPIKLQLMDPEDRYLREVEGHDERAPDEGRRVPAPVMPWDAHGSASPAGVSPSASPAAPAPAYVAPAPLAAAPLPPAGLHPQAAATPAQPPAGPAKPASRFARPAAAAAPAPAFEPAVLDVFHPAIAARRPAPDVIDDPDDPARFRRARRTMFFAATVLVAIFIAAWVLVFGE
jgi:pSer/pThr/pTyr-binding forkhead associated (FHA) protein